MDNQLRNRRLLVGGIAALFLLYAGHRHFGRDDHGSRISITANDDEKDGDNKKADEGDKSPFQIDVDNKGGSVSIKSSIGSADVKIPAFVGKEMGNLDVEGIKLYPGAKMARMQVKSDREKDENKVQFTFDAPASIQAVHDYYSNGLKEKGFEVTGDANNFKAHKDDKSFTLALSGSGNETHGVMSITEED